MTDGTDEALAELRRAITIVLDGSSDELVVLLESYGLVDNYWVLTTYPRQLHRIRAVLRAALAYTAEE